VSKDVLQIGQGSLYPALHRLEYKGWIRSDWGNSEGVAPDEDSWGPAATSARLPFSKPSLRRCSMLCEFARERPVGLFLRRLRHLLPLQESLPGEIFISARSMPKKLRQRFEVTILGNEAAFKVPLKHHADIEG
jgi:hypothetical protein